MSTTRYTSYPVATLFSYVLSAGWSPYIVKGARPTRGQVNCLSTNEAADQEGNRLGRVAERVLSALTRTPPHRLTPSQTSFPQTVTPHAWAKSKVACSAHCNWHKKSIIEMWYSHHLSRRSTKVDVWLCTVCTFRSESARQLSMDKLSKWLRVTTMRRPKVSSGWK